MENNNNPWMGLKTYTEGQTLYGRYKEIQELSQAIMYNRQTVVYGMSGIGKSSLLNAGIFPVLRKSRFFPVNVRLIHKDEELSYSAQIIKKIQQSLNDLRREIVDDDGLSKTIRGLKGTCIEVFPKADGQEESLWKYLHRHRFMNDNDNEIHPVIVLDQFEEIFTLCEDEATKIDFFNQLADLINDLPPSDIFDNANKFQDSSQEQVEQHHSENDELVLIEDDDDDVFEVRYLNESNYRIVISLREEFLSYLERYTTGIPSMKYNRFGVNPLTVDQAYSIIMEPRPGLISHDVATEIISKVTGENVESINSKDKKPYIHVDSAILSLFLSELYEMKESNEKTISLKLLQDTGDNIIKSYYEKSISDISDSSIVFLEDNLVTEDERRDSVFKSQVLKYGVTSDELTILKERRIIHEFPWNNDGFRIEFMHDRLCPVITKRRIQRKQSWSEKQKVFDTIQARQKKAKKILADLSIDIDKRIEYALYFFSQIDDLARNSEYDNVKYEDLLSDFAMTLHKYGQYEKAIDIYNRQLSLAISIYGDNSPHIIAIYNNISELYGLTGDYTKSLEYGFKALDLSKGTLDQENPEVAITYNNIGEAYHNQGLYEDALNYYHKALDIRETKLGDKHQDTAKSYNNIGTIYYSLGFYPKALEYYEKALEIQMRVLDSPNPEIAISYDNIGGVHESQGNYSKALTCYEKALGIRTSALGTEHPDTASSYNNIGSLYRDQGDYPKALEYLFKALTINEKTFSIEHPVTAMSYNNVGGIYHIMGDYSMAIDYYFKALEIQEYVLGKKHPDTVTTYNNIGGVYNEQGDYSLALEYYRKALDTRVEILGLEHPDTATSYNNIGMVYDSQGEYSKALEYLFKALAIREKVLGPEHPSVATSFNNIGGVYDSLDEYQIALKYYFKALEIYRRVLGEGHPSLATIYNNIGWSYSSMADYSNAFNYFSKALNIYKKKYGENHPHTQIMSKNIEFFKEKLEESQSTLERK